jgi:hypothetical protein
MIRETERRRTLVVYIQQPITYGNLGWRSNLSNNLSDNAINNNKEHHPKNKTTN